jgi:N-acylneuraminate cytidylyltransferase
MRLAVIPARGGSKRIPRKNIKVFGDKPMIAWSIEVAIASRLFDHVIVSTDDAEIADVSKAHGAIVPFMRPAELSDDHTETSAVVAHAINWWQSQIATPELVCCIYATAPFISAVDLQRGMKLLTETSSDFAFSVTSYTFPIQRALKLTKSDRVEMFQPECFKMRSQDLEEAYHDAGQFYWGRPEAWLSEKPVFTLDSSAVILPSYRVQDIDTLEDWARAELMFKAMQKELLV